MNSTLQVEDFLFSSVVTYLEVSCVQVLVTVSLMCILNAPYTEIEIFFVTSSF